MMLRAGTAGHRGISAEQLAAKAGTIVATLSHFGLIRFGGHDAQQFLQRQLSCDVDSLGTGHAQYGSYNTPQGRMLASFLLWRDESGYFMQLPRSMRESIQQRLSTYILRSKVKAVDASDDHVLIGVAGADSRSILRPWFSKLPTAPLAITAATDASLLRLDGNRFEIVTSPQRTQELMKALSRDAIFVGQTMWDWTEIRAGIPHVTSATQDQFVPQMANLDLLGGVSFSKGCYPGQEIVARMHYLGRLKQRMYLANIAGHAAPQPGDKLFSSNLGGQASGMIVNAAPSPDGGHDVLAVIRIESARTDIVHWQSPDGPQLKFLELPYKT